MKAYERDENLTVLLTSQIDKIQNVSAIYGVYRSKEGSYSVVVADSNHKQRMLGLLKMINDYELEGFGEFLNLTRAASLIKIKRFDIECRICEKIFKAYHTKMVYCDDCKQTPLHKIYANKISKASRYKITLDTLLKLEAVTECELCKRDISDTNQHSIDHCHNSNAVRGVLCRRCNSNLGWYEDNLTKIQNYLLRKEVE